MTDFRKLLNTTKHLYKTNKIGQYKLELDTLKENIEEICLIKEKFNLKDPNLENLKEIRIKCAEEANMGNDICGTCVSRLYKNLEKNHG